MNISRKQLESQIFGTLDARFIRHQKVSRILALALASGTNVLLWGPGGHGKSEMVTAALAAVANDDDIFVQSFGEGMDEATLWGGLDFRALDVEKVLRYFPENSFLNYEFAVFEEIFDAPASVLLGLKDTLTAKKLRKGSQVFAMKTKVIIALTNKDPDEISQLGPAAAALIERFPLQLKVDWDSYDSQAYLQLFAKIAPSLDGADLNGQSRILAEVMAKAGENGEGVISPRTAVHALRIVKASASLRGSNLVEKQDLLDLCYLPGMEQFAATLQQELDAATERASAEARVQQAQQELNELLLEFADAERAQSPLKLLQVSKRFVAYQDGVASLKVTDNLTNKRKEFRDAASEKAAKSQQLAVQFTRI